MSGLRGRRTCISGRCQLGMCESGVLTWYSEGMGMYLLRGSVEEDMAGGREREREMSEKRSRGFALSRGRGSVEATWIRCRR